MEKDPDANLAEQQRTRASEGADDRNGGVNRRKALGRSGLRELDLAEPLYATPINVGALSGQPKLDQVLEQLNVAEDDFIYWTSS